MIFTDATGANWQIDYEGCEVLVRAWSQEKAWNENVSIRRNEEMWEVEFDSHAARLARQSTFIDKMGELDELLINDASQAVRLLAACHTEIPRLNRSWRDRFSTVNERNMQSVNRRVERAEFGLSVAQAVRDSAGMLLMALIPISSLGVTAALLANLGGSVFQGVGVYQDTGNASAAFLTANFSFTSSLLVLPAGGSRGATAIFKIHQTVTNATRNAAVSMMIKPKENPRVFTDALINEIATGTASVAFGQQLQSKLNQAIADTTFSALIPVVREGLKETATTGSRPRWRTEMSNVMVVDATSHRGPNFLRAHELRRQIDEANRRRRRQQQQRAFEASPFGRYFLSGDARDLMSDAERYVRGFLLTRT